MTATTKTKVGRANETGGRKAVPDLMAIEPRRHGVNTPGSHSISFAFSRDNKLMQRMTRANSCESPDAKVVGDIVMVINTRNQPDGKAAAEIVRGKVEGLRAKLGDPTLMAAQLTSENIGECPRWSPIYAVYKPINP